MQKKRKDVWFSLALLVLLALFMFLVSQTIVATGKIYFVF